jgi:hypothetical protein
MIIILIMNFANWLKSSWDFNPNLEILRILRLKSHFPRRPGWDGAWLDQGAEPLWT